MQAAGAEPEKDRRLFGKEMAEKKMERIAEGLRNAGCGGAYEGRSAGKVWI